MNNSCVLGGGGASDAFIVSSSDALFCDVREANVESPVRVSKVLLADTETVGGHGGARWSCRHK